MTQLTILNKPEDARYYEFVVVEPSDQKNNVYHFRGMYDNADEAEQKAKQCGGLIIHNVMIQGCNKPKKYYYVSLFSVIEATDEEEAQNIFEDYISSGGWGDIEVRRATQEEINIYVG